MRSSAQPTLHTNLLLSHHQQSQQQAAGQPLKQLSHTRVNDENARPNMPTRSLLSLNGAGKAGVFDPANKENCVVSRSTRLGAMGLMEKPTVTLSGTSTITNTALNQKPRRVLQEIKT